MTFSPGVPTGWTWPAALHGAAGSTKPARRRWNFTKVQGRKAPTQLAEGAQWYEMAAGEVNSTQGYTPWREAAEDVSMERPLTIKSTIHS